MSRYSRLSAAAAGLFMANFGLALCPAIVAQERASPDFTFGIISDLGYAPEQEPLLANVFAELNRTPLAFVVHVGDLGSPRGGSCTDELWAHRLAQFRASTNPLIYAIGDNEWTDCHAKAGAPGFDPLERLVKLRDLFFTGERSFGQRSIPLLRQSQSTDPKFAKYRENARWDLGGITFVTLHVAGSNNGLGRAPDGDAEFAERNSADLAWLHEGFAHAKANNSRAIMILQQANIFPEFSPFPGDPKQTPSGFTELRAALAGEAVAFGKPVVLVHGDSHYFRIDKPYMRLRRNADEPAIENFTRVETFGTPHHHWLQVTVEANEPNVFTFRPRIVAPNVLKGRND
jgi:hypothetical protein